MKKYPVVLIACVLAGLTMAMTSCKTTGEQKFKPLDPAKFETTVNGKKVSLYNLENNKGMMVQITNYGGRIVALWVPGKEGNYSDIVTGFDTIDGYIRDKSYFGALIGRYGNRIAGGKFTFDGKEYTLPVNNGPNSLHGGTSGFDHKVWDVKKNTPDSLVLHYLSKDGEEGYPGNLSVTVTYSLNDSNELKIDYAAETDAKTIVNLTNHAYFNLSGHDDGDILGHVLMIDADRYTPVDSTLIPTGELATVEGTPFDFRTPTAIGERIDADDVQIRYGNGYDHNLILNKDDSEMALAARVEDPVSGRIMEVYTTEPGVQFYTGNFLDGNSVGKNGTPYKFRHAFCLETQHFPDSPNHDNFPDTVLEPGEHYSSSTIYKFSTE